MGGKHQFGDELQIGVARIAALIGVIAYAASWIANLAIAGYRDPLELRVAVVIILAGTIVATYVSGWTVRHLPAVVRALIYIITVHDYALLLWNQLDPLQVVGTYLVFAGVVALSSSFVTRPRHLTQYLVTVAALSVIVSLLVDAPRTAKPQFLIGIVTFTALSFVAVRAHLETLRRLRVSEAQARAVLRAVPDVLVRLGRDGTIRAVLGEVHGELGQRVQALAGRPLDELLEPTRRQVAAALTPELKTGEIRSVSAPVRLARTGTLHVEVRVVTGDGESCLALLRDVTHEQRLEERLRINDRLAAIGTLASGLAHEINNPLSYVVSNLRFTAQRLRARLREAPDEEQEDELNALDDARQGADRIGAIVGSLRRYASGDEPPEPAADAGECVKAALAILESQIRHRAIVSVELAPMPRLRAEASRLTQILVNLVSNALQSVSHHGRGNGHVWIRGRNGGGSVTLEVQDDGCGIRAADVGRVFDPFYTTKSPGEGTGLGLYVCHQIVSAFGGTIDLTSVEGRGTTFRVLLPALEEANQAVPGGSR